MKNSTISVALALFASLAVQSAQAQAPVIERFSVEDTVAAGIKLSGISMKRNADLMTVSIDFDFEKLRMNGDRAIVYAPVIANGGDSLVLNPVGFYGRTRWIQYQRNGRMPFGADNESAFLFSKRPAVMDYSESVPYQDWMNGASLVLRRCDYGCCNHLIERIDVPLANWRQIEYKPALRYIRPTATLEKRYELKGQSFVDFPVDQTVIYPEYRRNTIELDSIRRTIDIARNNPDATIDTIWLKGFASPESPYKHNTDLAIGRTKALKEYVQNLYNFQGVTMLTDYEPEDWEGLRAAVVASNLEHRDQILAIIDSDMAPDPKEWKIKSTYPDEYKFMLQNFYPPLRHTNYRVSYTVRQYNDPQEILQIMKTRPGNLSLDEFYTAASVLEPGTEEFNDVFETAARMFPNDPVANLNAANSAISVGNYAGAARYLAKAGDSPEAEYARSVLATLTGEYEAAGKHLDDALRDGYAAPDDELRQLREVIMEYAE